MNPPGSCLVVCLLVACGMATAADGLELKFETSEGGVHPGVVVVSGLAPEILRDLEKLASVDLAELVTVYVGDAFSEGNDIPPVLGQVVVAADGLRFTPRFPFLAELEYQGHFDGPVLSRLLRLDSPLPLLDLKFSVDRPSGRAVTRVDAVYPSGSVLPSNLLRFYVHFSAPMLPKDVHRYLHLYDEAGAEVSLPFVEVPSGLWDSRHQRLTLFLHPGRVKRGIGPRESLGPVLQMGETYRLVIDQQMPDIGGKPLSASYIKEFRVVDEDRDQPRPARWVLSPPRDAEDTLTVRFPGALDHALLGRLIVLYDSEGNALSGEISILDEEKTWSFRPDTDWFHGDYELVVSPLLEDIAGNAVGHAFEEPLPRVEPAAGSPAPVALLFSFPAGN